MDTFIVLLALLAFAVVLLASGKIKHDR